jgi:hypothetical protein
MLASTKTDEPVVEKKESYRHRYIPMMVHTSTMGTRAQNFGPEELLVGGLSCTAASGTGIGVSEETELLVAGL